ncbi:MAG: hypothetical protein Q7R97_00170 [Candidatus Daviesbacteria bacterium]|nr:hypothetical protein [Candidatus Daviesbacteria bacterium]
MESATSFLGKKQIIGIVVIIAILIAVAVGVYLVQKQQSLKSKASSTNFINAFEMTNTSGGPTLACSMSATPGVAECNTNSLNVNVRVKDSAPLLP